MKSLVCVAAALSALAGCVHFGDSCSDDPGANHYAVNPATGQCWQFQSSCDVPSGWAACGSPQCQKDSDCIAGTGCIRGACTAVGLACTTDDDCALTQYCQLPGAAPEVPVQAAGMCENNPPCNQTTDCPMGQW